MFLNFGQKLRLFYSDLFICPEPEVDCSNWQESDWIHHIDREGLWITH